MTEVSSKALYRLDRLGTIVVTGADARAFLQGQLSFDLDRLTTSRIELACCSSAQGRVQAVLWLLQRSDSIVLLLPTVMVESTLIRLKKYVLRSKVKLDSGAGRLAVSAAAVTSIGAVRTHIEQEGRSFVQWPGATPRVLTIGDISNSASADDDHSNAWIADDIAAGLPQVYPQTHEAFVAQMLNIDLLEGISFEKGCYTGQEIIARTHFRGTVKRRMLRFRVATTGIEPGMKVLFGEQHAGDVVDAVATAQGSQLLAAVSLAHSGEQLRLSSAAGPILEPLPLPYPLSTLKPSGSGRG